MRRSDKRKIENRLDELEEQAGPDDPDVMEIVIRHNRADEDGEIVDRNVATRLRWDGSEYVDDDGYSDSS